MHIGEEKSGCEEGNFGKGGFERKSGCNIFVPTNFVTKFGDIIGGSKRFATKSLLKAPCSKIPLVGIPLLSLL